MPYLTLYLMGTFSVQCPPYLSHMEEFWCPPDHTLHGGCLSAPPTSVPMRGFRCPPDPIPHGVLITAPHPQQHEILLPSGQRAGFLIGDGAGVGKGRTVAGIILENYLRGRKKSLWCVFPRHVGWVGLVGDS